MSKNSLASFSFFWNRGIFLPETKTKAKNGSGSLFSPSNLNYIEQWRSWAIIKGGSEVGPRNLHIGTPRLVSVGIGGREKSDIRLAVGYVWHVDMLGGLRESHTPGDWHLESAGGEAK